MVALWAYTTALAVLFGRASALGVEDYEIDEDGYWLPNNRVPENPLGDWVEPESLERMPRDDRCGPVVCDTPRMPYRTIKVTEEGSASKDCSSEASEDALFCPPADIKEWTQVNESAFEGLFARLAVTLPTEEEDYLTAVNKGLELAALRRVAVALHGFAPAAPDRFPDHLQAPTNGTSIENDVGGGGAGGEGVTFTVGGGSVRRRRVFKTNYGTKFGGMTTEVPGAPDNCARTRWCHETDNFKVGGNGGSECSLCAEEDCSNTYISSMGIRSCEYIDQITVYWQNPSGPARKCGFYDEYQTETQEFFGLDSTSPCNTNHHMTFEKVDEGRPIDCINKVTGAAGAYVDGLQFWGYKRSELYFDRKTKYRKYHKYKMPYLGSYRGWDHYFEINAPEGFCLAGMKTRTGKHIDQIEFQFRDKPP